MTSEQIEILFFEAIQEKAVYNKLEGVTENQIYNWRKQRTTPSIGDMLGVLYQLKKIEVNKYGKCLQWEISPGFNTEPIMNKNGKVYNSLEPVPRPNPNSK